MKLVRLLQRLEPVLRFRHPEAGEEQVLGAHLAGVLVVVHHQDERLLAGLFAGGAWGSGLGGGLAALLCGFHRRTFRRLVSWSVNVEPLPIWLCRVTLPFSIVASRRTMESPRPVPPYWRVGELST